MAAHEKPTYAGPAHAKPSHRAEPSPTPMRRAVATIAGLSALTSSMAGTIIAIAPEAGASPAPGQDVLNDWGQTAAEVLIEVDTIVDADPRVVQARTRYLRALSAYASIKKVEAAATSAYRTAKLTRTLTDDVRARANLVAVRQRTYAAATEVVVSQLAATKIVTAVRAQVRARHYIKAPYVALPSTPQSVVALGAAMQVSLSWAPVDGAASYRIFRDGTQVATTIVPSYLDTAVENDMAYGYTVMAVNIAGWSPMSAEVVGMPTATTPGVPSGVVASPGDGRITLTWTASSSATGYQVFRDGTQIGSPTTTTFVDTGRTNGTSYSYTVKAVNGTVLSAASAAVTGIPVATAPAAPTALVASAGNHLVSLTWNASLGATNYSVYRNGALLMSTAATTYNDTTALNGTTYSYYVVAFTQNSVASAASNTVSATPVAPPLSTPTGLAATPGNAQVALSWTAVSGATSYRVFRGATQVATPTTPSYTDTGLTNGTAYTYTVVAVGPSSVSPASSPVTATPVAPAPSTPTGLAGTPGNAGATLTWTAVPGATSYKVFRNGTQVAAPTTPTFTDSGLTNGVTYSYYVKATSTGGDSAASSTVQVTPAAPPLATPTGLAASPGDAQVTLSWSAVSGATSYRVYRGATLVGSPATTTFTDTGLTNGTAYSYTVVAVGTSSTSAATTPVTATPAAAVAGAPTGLTGQAGDASATLSWTAVPGATSYKVFRDGVQVATPTSPSFADTGLTNGTTYSYYVVAVSGAGDSPASSTVQVTPAAAPLPTPTGLSATPGNAQVALSWTAVSGATSYRVYRGATLVGSPATTSFTDTGVTNGTTYSYTVVAVGPTSTSAASSPATATPAIPAPSAPTGLTGQAGDTIATLTWTAVPGATSYKVFRNGVQIATPAGNSYTDSAVANGTTYSYYVKATSAGGDSAASSTVQVTPFVLTPAVPTGVVASTGNAQIVLSWTASANAQSYRVYRNGALVGSPTGTTFTDTGLVNGTAYSYTITAVNGSATSAASTAVSGTPLAPAPGAPTGLTATPGNAQVVLAWTAVPTATAYHVYRGGVLVGSPTTTTYTDTLVTNGTAYSYYVKAVASTTEGAASATVTATPTKPLVSGTFTGTTAQILDKTVVHGTIRVVIVIVDSKITTATGTLLTNDGTETASINRTAIPQYNTKAVVANSAVITKVSGATLTWTAYKTSLQSALTQAGL
jgi:fibronectin type 3 domain-containing protein